MSDPLSVLIIDDDPGTCTSLRQILQLDGYRVETSTTAAEALDRDNWESFFAIILDRKLPDGTAEEILPRLKKLAPEAAVVIVTGYSDLDGAVEALRAGATDYILKPINPDAFRASLARIADHRRAEKALDESELRFRQLTEHINQVFWLSSADNSEMLYASPAYEQIWGRSCESLYANPKSFLEAVHPDDRERIEAGLPKQAEEDYEEEYRIVRPDGSVRWIHARAFPIRNPAGNVDRVAGISEDITDRKQAQEWAVQAERLAAIGQMVTGLAHESRNALQRAQACLEMLSLDLEQQPELLDLTSRAQKALDDLQRLYEEVRGYAAPIKLDRQMCDLSEIWNEVWSQLDVMRRGKTIQFVAETQEANLRCEVDRHSIGQVFRNILENAVSACPDPGQISLRCAETDLHGKPAIRISLHDNGPGLSAEQKLNIFDPFFTTKTKGTGLGMAIAKRIIKAHQGEIAVGDSSGLGAEIVVTLPRTVP